MKDSGIIILLKSFSKDEIKEFEKYIRSPYFMEGKNIRSKILVEYFAILKEYYPAFESSDFTKQNIYKRLYTPKVYNDILIRKLNSDLKKLAENFIILKQFENDSIAAQKYLLEALSYRKLDKQFIKQMENTNAFLSEYKLIDSNYYLNNYDLTKIINNFYLFRNEMLNKYDIQKESDHFASYAVTRSLEVYRNMVNLEQILNVNYKKDFLSDVLNYVSSNKVIIENTSLVAILYYECMLNVYKKEEYFINLKELKDKYSGMLDDAGLYNIYTSLTNFCIRMTNLGYEKYRVERFQLDKEIIFLDYYSKKEYIDYNYFSSAARNAIAIGEIEWAKSFIEKYKSKLDPKHSDFILSYIQALMNFKIKNYGDALECLSKINIEYSMRKQQLKNLQLKIYYEMGAYESAYSVIDSSLHILKKEEQMLERRKNVHLIFLKYTKELIDIKLNPDMINKSILENKLKKENYFVNKEWLIEKIKNN